MTQPTFEIRPEVAAADAAYRRELQARDEVRKAEVALHAANEAWFPLADESIRLQKLAQPLEQLLLHRIIDASPNPTIAALVKYTHRSHAEVTAEVERLTGEGPIEWYGKWYVIRRDGKRYTAEPTAPVDDAVEPPRAEDIEWCRIPDRL